MRNRKWRYREKQLGDRIASLRFSKFVSWPPRMGLNNSTCVSSRVGGCAVKRRWSTAGVNPPGNWFAPPGSNQSSSGGNETAEASGAESR
jgi:hypothetical protein